jgi:hypothetical protein
MTSLNYSMILLKEKKKKPCGVQFQWQLDWSLNLLDSCNPFVERFRPTSTSTNANWC